MIPSFQVEDDLNCFLMEENWTFFKWKTTELKKMEDDQCLSNWKIIILCRKSMNMVYGGNHNLETEMVQIYMVNRNNIIFNSTSFRHEKVLKLWKHCLCVLKHLKIFITKINVFIMVKDYNGWDYVIVLHTQTVVGQV